MHSSNMPSKPMRLASPSRLHCLAVVPDETRQWKPEMAPQAMVTNIIGHISPKLAKPPLRLKEGKEIDRPVKPPISRAKNIRAMPP